MLFRDRVDAGRQLAERIAEQLIDDLAEPDGPAPVILGLPRGGVPVAAEVAARLHAPLDIILVRKLGVPAQPELGFGAIGEDGVRVLSAEIMRAAGVTEHEATHIEARARTELVKRAELFRSVASAVPLAGRTAVIVDDGLATGSTAMAAAQVARAHGASRVMLAVAVAPPDWTSRCAGVADEMVAVATPVGFSSVGQWYEDFSPTTEDEVMEILRAARREDQSARLDPAIATTSTQIQIPWGVEGLGEHLIGDLVIPEHPTGIVIFAHGSGSSRHSSRNRLVADHLHTASIATLLIDLLTDHEQQADQPADEHGIDEFGARMVAAIDWVRAQSGLADLKIGVCGASTGAAVALWAAARPGSPVAAVVSRGGRPDLARHVLHEVRAPTLLIVGSRDHQVLQLNTEAGALLTCEKELTVVPGATHLFEESGTLVEAAEAATKWFIRHLA
jgi:putative phosphoribosyl transferase